MYRTARRLDTKAAWLPRDIERHIVAADVAAAEVPDYKVLAVVPIEEEAVERSLQQALLKTPGTTLPFLLS